MVIASECRQPAAKPPPTSRQKNTQPFAYYDHSPYITLYSALELTALSASSINNIIYLGNIQPAQNSLLNPTPGRSIRFMCFVHDSCSSTISCQTDSTRTCWSADGERGRKQNWLHRKIDFCRISTISQAIKHI